MKHLEFGDRLRKIIKERRISGRKLANKLNVAPSTVSCYVNNQRRPEYEILVNISKELNVSIDYLLGCSLINDPKFGKLNEIELFIIEIYRRASRPGKKFLENAANLISISFVQNPTKRKR